MSQDIRKRILIVDDEPQVAMILAESLKRVGSDYAIDTAGSGEEALANSEQAPYDLVLTDYSMPQMSGLELAEALQKRSPGTQIVLMTAYGTEQLQNSIEQMQLAGYVDKPFTANQIREIVVRALEHTRAQSHPPSDALSLGDPVYKELEQLQSDTGARCVMLLSSDGYPVAAVGETGQLDISSLSALIAANFAAAAELAKMLGNGSIFKSSYHEGPDYNIYSYDINGEFLLAVLFGPTSKVGAVWFFAKQTATALIPLLAEQSSASNLDGDFAVAIDAEMDRLFGEGNGVAQRGALMNIEEAIAAGLLPPEIVDDLSP